MIYVAWKIKKLASFYLEKIYEIIICAKKHQISDSNSEA
jgi:hypothetical protein